MTVSVRIKPPPGPAAELTSATTTVRRTKARSARSAATRSNSAPSTTFAGRFNRRRATSVETTETASRRRSRPWTYWPGARRRASPRECATPLKQVTPFVTMPKQGGLSPALRCGRGMHGSRRLTTSLKLGGALIPHASAMRALMVQTIERAFRAPTMAVSRVIRRREEHVSIMCSSLRAHNLSVSKSTLQAVTFAGLGGKRASPQIAE
jgi:hypothetical protein